MLYPPELRARRGFLMSGRAIGYQTGSQRLPEAPGTDSHSLLRDKPGDEAGRFGVAGRLVDAHAGFQPGDSPRIQGRSFAAARPINWLGPD